MAQWPLSDADRRLLERLGRELLGGVRAWMIPLVWAGITALALMLLMDASGSLWVPLGVLLAGGLVLHAWIAHVLRRAAVVQRDLAAGQKRVLQGPMHAVHADGQRLRYQVGGRLLAVRPVLMRAGGAFTGALAPPTVRRVQAFAGLEVELHASQGEDLLLALFYPALAPEQEDVGPLQPADRSVVRAQERAAWRAFLWIQAGAGVLMAFIAWLSTDADGPFLKLFAMLFGLWLLASGVLAGGLVLARRARGRPAQVLHLRGPVAELIKAEALDVRQRALPDTPLPVMHGRITRWIRVGRYLIDSSALPDVSLGATVQLHATLDAGGLVCEVLSLEVLPTSSVDRPLTATPAARARPAFRAGG